MAFGLCADKRGGIGDNGGMAENDVYEGRYNRINVQIAGWSLNADERANLRKIIERVLLLNLPIFDAVGFNLVEWTQQDEFDFESFGAPVFQAVFNFSALFPFVVTDKVTPIRHVETYPNGETETA